jgi:hypothetical protein
MARFLLASVFALLACAGISDAAFAQSAQGVAPFASGNVGSHFLPVGPVPTISAGCTGAGSAMSANANDSNGTVTGSTAASTTCTITFTNAYTSTPDCVASGISSPLLTQTVTTTTFVETHASTANFKFSYICVGK